MCHCLWVLKIVVCICLLNTSLWLVYYLHESNFFVINLNVKICFYGTSIFPLKFDFNFVTFHNSLEDRIYICVYVIALLVSDNCINMSKWSYYIHTLFYQYSYHTLLSMNICLNLQSFLQVENIYPDLSICL